MAAHSPVTPVIQFVPPEQPLGVWPNWLRQIAQAINTLGAWANQPVLLPLTFEQLPPAPPAGTLGFITDGSAVVGAPAGGGGSTPSVVWFNGTDWKVLGT
jgi:hypothetical protein